MTGLVGKTLRSLRTNGVRGTVHRAMHTISEVWNERRFGISTARYVRAREAGIDSPFSNDYRATDYRTLFRVIRKLRVQPGSGAFLDYGSGMGRVVVVAATLPFGRVIGLELSHELNEIARVNVERARKWLRSPRVEIVDADAMNYEVPRDVTVIFLYNPFVGEVLDAVLDRVRESLTASPRDLTIVYKPPAGTTRPLLDGFDWLERHWAVSDIEGREAIGYRSR